MRRLALLSVVSAVLLAGLPAAAQARSGYCSPTGDYCTQVKKRSGVWRITLQTFAFRGRVRTCVTTPAGERTCRRFRLRAIPAAGGLYGFDARWSRHFPDRGAGTYRVRFTYGGSTLGPRLTFTR
jgi:hypothetical protein